MSDLAQINDGALSVPGLRFRGHRPDPNPFNRSSIIAQNEKGAIELWSEPHSPQAQQLLGEETMGGIVIHSPRQLFDVVPEPESGCDILGGPCWSDGSFLAYRKTFLPLIRARAAEAILRELAGWHESHFGGAA